MANAGNESDLKVLISVDSSQVKQGFNDILNDARSFKSNFQSILGNMDFSRVFNYSEAVAKEVQKAQRKLNSAPPLRLKFNLGNGKSIGTTIKGEMDNLDGILKELQGRFDKAKESMEAFDTISSSQKKVDVEKEHNDAVREYIGLLKQVRQVETQMGIASYRADKFAGTAMGSAYSAQYASLVDLRNLLRSRLGAVSAKNGGYEWFNANQMKQVADLSDQIAKSEAEASLEARRMADAKREQEESEKRLVKAYAASLYVYRLALRYMRMMVGAIKSAISASDELYQAQFKLAAAMKVNSDVTNEQVRGMFSYVRALSEANGLSLEANYNAAQILASYVDTEESLKGLLSAYDDLVIKMKGYGVNSQQAATIAKQLARALAGDTNAISKYGFVLSEAEKKALKSSAITNAEKVDILISAIRRKTGDISKESETWAGMINRIKVNSSLIRSNFGLALQNALYPMLKVVLFISQGIERISEGLVELSRFVFGDNIKGAEELAGWLSDIDDELNSIQSRLLSFDKFNVLGGDSSILGGKDKDGDKDGDGSDVGSPDTDAWRQWLDLIGNVTGASTMLKGVLVAIGVALAGIAVSVASMAALTMAKKIKDMVTSLGALNKNLGITKSQIGTLFAGITLLITGIMTLMEGITQIGRWDELTGVEKATAVIKVVVGVVASLGGVILLTKFAMDRLSASIAKYNAVSVTSMTATQFLAIAVRDLAIAVASVASLAAGIALFVQNFQGMSTLARVLVPVTAAIFGLAAAVVALRVAEAGWLAAIQAGIIAAGLTLAVGSVMTAKNQVTAHANGGIPTRGQLFIANESGPELVGNIGGRTSVANNSMITQAIEEAAYRGFSRANGEGGAGNVTLTLQGDGVRNDALVRALMPALKTEVRRQGGLKKAFGGE